MVIILLVQCMHLINTVLQDQKSIICNSTSQCASLHLRVELKYLSFLYFFICLFVVCLFGFFFFCFAFIFIAHLSSLYTLPFLRKHYWHWSRTASISEIICAYKQLSVRNNQLFLCQVFSFLTNLVLTQMKETK